MADKDFKVKNGIDVAGNANIGGNLNAAKYQASAPSSPVTGQLWVDSDAVAGALNQNDYLLKNDFEVLSVPIGGISQYAGATSPSANWAICDGAAVSRTTYATLFARIGTAYGVGDNSTTFNVPNLKGRVPVGLDSTQTEFDTRGEIGGAKTHALTSTEMPRHNHGFNPAAIYGTGSGGTGAYAPSGNNPVAFFTTFFTGGTATTEAATNGAPHNNMQPYLVMNYLIRIA